MNAPRAGLVLGALCVAGGCQSAEEQEQQCVGPIVELVRWREEVETARILRGEAIPPEALAVLEREHVQDLTSTLGPRRRACELTWSVLMHQAADTPSLRLREEALLRVLDLPARDYDVAAVGWAGVTTDGRRPVAARR